MRCTLLPGVALLLAVVANGLHAHEVRPAYLELRQTGPETYDVLWKVPARGDLRLGLYVRLPESCQHAALPASSHVADAFIERFSVHCPGGLSGNKSLLTGLLQRSRMCWPAWSVLMGRPRSLA